MSEVNNAMNKQIEELKKYNTPNISDAIDKLGINGQLYGIKPIQFGHRVAGPIYTVKYMSIGEEVTSSGDFLDEVPPGAIIVIDNEGRTDCTSWGDLMTKVAIRNKIEATIINGACRDIDVIIELSYPIYAKGYYMRTAKDRVIMQGTNIPLSISGVLINPGDIAMADDSGVVVIPQNIFKEVLKLVKEIYEAEENIEKAIGEGDTLVGARKKFKYHELQRKEK